MADETGFARPSLGGLKTQITSDLRTRLANDAGLRRSDLDVQATVQAGALHGVYGYLDWQARQILPDLAEDEFLIRHASLWGIRQKSASVARGTVRFAVSRDAVIPIGTVLQHQSSGDFITTGEALGNGTTVLLPVEAVNAGLRGNLASGEILSLVKPIVGVESEAVCVEELTGGADAESIDSLRSRLLERIRQPPHGGASFDYVTWALQVPGVTRAWVYPLFDGPGTVGLAFVMDERADIIPLPGDVEQVQAYIDLMRPVTADVRVFAPVPVPLDLAISLFPDTPSVRAAVVAELQEFLRTNVDPGSTVWQSRLGDAITKATGEHHHTLISPAGDAPLVFGHMAVLGTVDWGRP